MKPAKRILFYSHDTFGLGHIRRTQKLANEVAGEGRSILIACASPKASSFASSPGIEYLNLPGFTKQISGEYVPRSLNLPIEDFVQLRSSLLLSTVHSFRPDMVIIDKEPLGVKRELLPALEYLRNYNKSCQIVCGFRDILDEDEAVKRDWFRRDTAHVLENYFDHVLIYGDQSIFDFAKEYRLSETLASKLHYTGYIQPEETKANSAPADLHLPFADSQLPLVTLTLGGGGDGADILEMVLNFLEERETKFNMNILTGPFAPLNLIARAKDLSRRKLTIFAQEFVANTFDVFKQSDLVVSMGGYNTMTELVSMRKYPLILPRVKPRKEQLLRAEVFHKMGFCDYIVPENVTPSALFEKIDVMLKEKRQPPRFPSEGLSDFRKWMDQNL